jgi:hypothetical protein
MTAVMSPAETPHAERRSSGLLRVPFVRRCNLSYDDGRMGSAFIVNINVLGAYVARDDVPLAAPSTKAEEATEGGNEMPELGQVVRCRFPLPEQAYEITVEGVVSWVNPRQQHPVHSLPPGFGIRFVDLALDARISIKEIVDEYLTRHPGAR